MGIQKNFVETSQIIQPGQHVVSVIDVKFGTSKKGQPMLTLTFQAANQAKIRGYFVKTTPFHQATLRKLKEHCGLSADALSEELLGKKCGVLVGKQPPNEEGIQFMQVEGYGSVDDVEASAPPTKDKVDDIKW